MARQRKADEDLGLTVEDLFADTHTFTTRFWKGKPLEITWAPLKFTADVEERVRELLEDAPEDPEPEEGESEESAARSAAIVAHTRRRISASGSRLTVSEVVVSWSLKTEEGKPWPLDPASLARLPDQFINAVLDAINEAAGPKAPSESPSSDTPS